VRVLKFDTDEQPDLAELFRIGGLPTLLFLVAGSNGAPKVRKL
jgi:thioredoxin-like negative regulator of GroEL